MANMLKQSSLYTSNNSVMPSFSLLVQDRHAVPLHARMLHMLAGVFWRNGMALTNITSKASNIMSGIQKVFKILMIDIRWESM